MITGNDVPAVNGIQCQFLQRRLTVQVFHTKLKTGQNV